MPPHPSWTAYVIAPSGQAFCWTWTLGLLSPTSLSSTHEIQRSPSRLGAIDLSSRLNPLSNKHNQQTLISAPTSTAPNCCLAPVCDPKKGWVISFITYWMCYWWKLPTLGTPGRLNEPPTPPMFRWLSINTNVLKMKKKLICWSCWAIYRLPVANCSMLYVVEIIFRYW